MWRTCSVQLNVRLPQEVAEHVREVEASDPEFLSKVVLYGLTRRSIYQQLRQDPLQRAGGESTDPGEDNRLEGGPTPPQG